MCYTQRDATFLTENVLNSAIECVSKILDRLNRVLCGAPAFRIPHSFRDGCQRNAARCVGGGIGCDFQVSRERCQTQIEVVQPYKTQKGTPSVSAHSYRPHSTSEIDLV